MLSRGRVVGGNPREVGLIRSASVYSGMGGELKTFFSQSWPRL